MFLTVTRWTISRITDTRQRTQLYGQPSNLLQTNMKTEEWKLIADGTEESVVVNVRGRAGLILFHAMHEPQIGMRTERHWYIFVIYFPFHLCYSIFHRVQQLNLMRIRTRWRSWCNGFGVLQSEMTKQCHYICPVPEWGSCCSIGWDKILWHKKCAKPWF